MNNLGGATKAIIPLNKQSKKKEEKPRHKKYNKDSDEDDDDFISDEDDEEEISPLEYQKFYLAPNESKMG